MSKTTKSVELSDRFTDRVSSAVMAAAALSLAAAGLAGCGVAPDTNAHAFTSVAQCASSGLYSRADCQSMDSQARSLHNSSAPRYESRKDCEDDYGRERCETRSGGGGGYVYSPGYYGYYGGVAGSAANDTGSSTTTRSVASSPIYRMTDGVVHTAQGNSVSSQAFSRAGAPTHASSLKASASPTAIAKGTSVVKSGGFGGTARGMSVGG